MAWGLMHLGEVYLTENQVDTSESLLKKAVLLLQKKNHPTYYIALEKLSDLYARKAFLTIRNKDTQHFHIYTKQALRYLEQALENISILERKSSNIIRIRSKLEKFKQQIGT